LSFKGYIGVGRILAACIAVAGLGVGILGFLEALYYAPASGLALLYGFGLYGLLGVAVGLLLALLFGGRARGSEQAVAKTAGTVAAIPAVLLILTAGGFLVWRDLWMESVSSAGLLGWVVMLLVPVGAAGYVLVARALGRILAGRAKGAATLVVFSVVLATILGAMLDTWSRGSPPAGEKSDPRPPVILVVADALRADAVGPELTPNLQAFSKDAVVFQEAWSAATWTRPAVASILTGRYPSTHRAVHKTDRLPGDLPTLAGLLSQRGYRTLASVTNVNLAPVFGLGRGFEVYCYHAPRPFLGAPVSASRLFLVEIYRLLRLRFFPGHREVFRYYAEGERVLKQGRALMDPYTKKPQPFLAYLHFMEPHDPYFAHPYDGRGVARVENPHPPVAKAGEYLDLYRQEVKHFDKIFGDLAAYLKESNLYHRSLIIFTADHGEEFADHGGFWHGTSLYRELVRVPLMIRFPAGAGAGTVQREPVSLVDLLPTVLSAAGAEPPGDLPGRILSPEPRPDRRVLFAQEDHQGCILSAVRAGPWKLIRANPGNPRDLPGVQLFDLSTDPAEKKDLSATEADLRDELLRVLDEGPAAAPAKPAGEKVELDSATQEQLRSLGYTE
jgi:arylsulfatase A-like enzyme